MIEQATVHLLHADRDTNLPVSIYLVHLSRTPQRGAPLPDPGGYGLVSAARVMPGTGKLVAVLAQGAPVVGGRAPLPEPDREGIPLELVGVVEGGSRVGVEAALYVRAGLLPQGALVADDLHAGAHPAVILHEAGPLYQEEATLHPLVGHPPPHVPRELPGADQPVQFPEGGAGLARLLPVTPGLGGVGVLHGGPSFLTVCLPATCLPTFLRRLPRPPRSAPEVAEHGLSPLPPSPGDQQ